MHAHTTHTHNARTCTYAHTYVHAIMNNLVILVAKLLLLVKHNSHHHLNITRRTVDIVVVYVHAVVTAAML